MYRKQPSQLAPSFFFKRRRERLNWRVLAGIDVSQIQKEIDVQALQDIMENLTYCDIEAEDLAIDPNYIKIFQLAQMVIEYLVHSQDYLIDSRKALAERAQAFMSELEQTRASNNSYKTEMAALRKETRVLKKSLYAFQIMTKLSHPINSVLPTAANNSASYHKCPLCSKLFVTSAYLKAHTQRRHPHTFHPQDTETASTDIAPRKRPEEAAEKMMANMDKVTAKMLETERQLRRDMETRLEKELQYRQNSMDLALQQEKARFQQQLNDMKAELQRSLAEDRSKLDFERDELSRVKAQLQTAESQKSKFGSLEDEESTRSNVKPVPESPSKTQESIDMKAFQDALQNEIKELKMLANKEPGHLSASDREAIKQIATEWRQSDREALEALKQQIADLKKGNQAPPAPPPQIIQQVEPASKPKVVEPPVVIRQADPPKEVVPEIEVPVEPKAPEPLTWDLALKLMAQHKETPIPTSPHIKAYLPHTADQVATYRTQISHSVNQTLHHDHHIPGHPSTWYKTDSATTKTLKRASVTFDRNVLNKKRQDPMYKLMSEHIGAKIDKLALTEKTKMGARPPPIMTKHPPPPSKRLIQSRARNEQKRSRSVPPQTPALGGYKFPSLKRRDNESVQWSDEESSEFSGSESEVSDTSSASTAFRNRRQKATKFNQRKGSRRSSQSPSRSSPASATTPASDWLLRSMSVPPSPGGTLREKFRKFTDAITFKRNKTADATLWLQQQQREAMERRRSSAAGSDTQSPRRNKRLPKPPTQDQIQEQTEEESSETESEEEEEESERGRRQVDYTSPTRHIAPASTRTSNAYLGHSNWRNRATNIAAAGGRDSGPASALSPQRHQQPVSGWADSAPKSADYIPALAGRSVMFSPVDDRSTEPPHRRTSNFRVPQDDTTSLSDEEEETSDQDTSDMGPATRAPAKVPTTTKNISPIREESEMDTNTTSELNKTTNHTTSSSNRSTSHPSTTNTSTSRPPKTPTSHSQPPPRKDPSTDSFIVSSPDSSMSSMPPPKQTPVTSKEHRTPVSKTKENDNYSDITSIDSFMETVAPTSRPATQPRQIESTRPPPKEIMMDDISYNSFDD